MESGENHGMNEDGSMIILPRHIVQGHCSVKEFMATINGLGGDIQELPAAEDQWLK